MKPEELPAGRELDAYIHEHIFGQVVEYGEFYKTVRNGYAVIPYYSTNIGDAFLLVEKLIDCLHLKQHSIDGIWEARFWGRTRKWYSGATPAEAICRAAVAPITVNGEEDDDQDSEE